MGAWRFFLSCVGCAGAFCRGGCLAAYLVNRPYPDPGSAGGGIS